MGWLASATPYLRIDIERSEILDRRSEAPEIRWSEAPWGVFRGEAGVASGSPLISNSSENLSRTINEGCYVVTPRIVRV